MRRWLTSAMAGSAVVLLALVAVLPVYGDDTAATCAGCHDETLIEHYAASPHGRMVEGDWFSQVQGCASCHGDVAAHAEEGDPELVRGFPGGSPEDDAALCLSCHSSVHAMGAWPAGEHALAGLSCGDCHRVHAYDDGRIRSPQLGVRMEEDIYQRCYECHPQVRAQIRLPSRHPLLEGKMNCGSCHNPHGTTEGLLKTEFRKNDVCLDCHAQMQGPHVFEHEPVVEDCSICHAPHGAVAEPLLVQTEPFLCLTCHEGHFHTVLGGADGAANTSVTAGRTFDPDGSYAAGPFRDIQVTNPFGRFGMKKSFLTKCTQCHSAVHGSDLPSAGTSGGGTSRSR